MDKLERAYRLHVLLKERRTPVSLRSLCEMFGCSESTAKRTLRDLKNLGAPIYCVEGQGHRYDPHIAFELPGVWFSPEELHALLTIERLAGSLVDGLFEEEIGVIREKTAALLGGHLPAPQEMRRIRVLTAGIRAKSLSSFALVASAVLERKQLHLTYHGRQRNAETERNVSPQRLVHYRGNWYLDAWCHRADDLRTFALERIMHARLLNEPCREVPDTELDDRFAGAFGIFSGKPESTAVLQFNEKAARWVRDEEWFPDQEMRELEGGSVELRIPYADPTELIMEICRYGPNVKVIQPDELRQQMIKTLQQTLNQYR